jgi:indolepyruvate ferredoxin oxidoreductase beta subunit
MCGVCGYLSQGGDRESRRTMNYQMVLVGVGGQGILFSTKLLAETAISMNYNVIGSETHGMSQRGGSVISYLKLGNFLSPVVRTGLADFIISFELNETYKNLKYIKKRNGHSEGGIIFANASMPLAESITKILEQLGITLKLLNADKIAQMLKAPLVSNLVLLGFASKYPRFPFQLEQLLKTTERISPKRFRDINIKALKQGFAAEGWKM